MVSSLSGLTSYFWGTNANNQVTAGNPDQQAPVFTEEVKKTDIVKEGYLYK
jgi:hypothetical protein